MPAAEQSAVTAVYSNVEVGDDTPIVGAAQPERTAMYGVAAVYSNVTT